MHKTLCFSFEAVKLLQQIPTNLKSSYFKGSTFFSPLVIKYIIRANDWLTFPLTSYLLFYTTGLIKLLCALGKHELQLVFGRPVILPTFDAGGFANILIYLL